ncbi:hypothetical protein THRCLA_23298 [Thraustotheca clavata]|uniref:Transmembrane protein n=1 Tax=Thraustotheca clavata TaxID=74557 RepID=A0A1V9Y7T7_9STRA|nr:hypothetical protein THRCLA_23298 [Thraustotheca clavata]
MTSSPPVCRVVPMEHASYINIHVINAMQSRRQILRLVFFVSCIWNLAAPLKAWVLTQYGFLPTDNTNTFSLEWNTMINGRFLTALYIAAGISLRKPLNQTRYINVFIDFMITPRSVTKWVHGLDTDNSLFQIDLDGNPMRSSLNGNFEIAQFKREVVKYNQSGFQLWGTERIFNFIPPATSNVSLVEVTEALLCLRNISLEVYVNCQFPSPLKPYTNEADEKAMEIWRNVLFPNLTQCLSRRAYLLKTTPSINEALTTLATELASTFNLSLTNIAGHRWLYTPYTFQDGFIDLTGQPSGSFLYSITGRDTTLITRAASSSLDAITVPREAAWWCAYQYIDPLTNTRNVSKCFQEYAVALPRFFLGKYLTVNAGNRYNDNDAFERVESIGQLSSYKYKTRGIPTIEEIEYVQPGNWSLWFTLYEQLIAATLGTPLVKTNALEEMCLVGDNCFSSCMNESASGGTTLTFMRGGMCMTSIDTVSHGLLDLYPDMKCFGLGTGTSNIQLTYLAQNGTRIKIVVNNTASPLAILTCFVGGRAPQIDLPSYLMDMLVQGPQAALVITRGNGSEGIILNFIALVALVGYLYYFGRTVLYLYSTTHWVLQRKKYENISQLLYSIVNCNISSVIWCHHKTSMQLVGFLSFIAWHLGAMQSQCTWNANALNDTSKDPVYTCNVNVFGHLGSFLEIARLFSYSWVFYALNFMGKMPGISTYVPGYILAIVLLGLLPLIVLAVLVGLICQLRLQIPLLTWVHNQFFLVLVWLMFFKLMQSRFLKPYVNFVERCLAHAGVQKQRIRRKSPFRALIGEYYWTETCLHREKDMMYLPLSVLMEIPSIKLSNIVHHMYYTCGIPVEDDCDAEADLRDEISAMKKPVLDTPKWVDYQVEYYVRVYEC